jgi:hypothetical protein
MSRKQKRDTTVEDVLRSRSYDSLAIKRMDRDCYLVVGIAGVGHVLANREGDAMCFRHAWQIREWLQSQFQITVDSIPVEIYR